MKTQFGLSAFVPAPLASTRPIYAYGAPFGPRQFLYEQDPGPAVQIRLAAPANPEVRWVLEAAVSRINELHLAYALRQGQERIAPDVRAAQASVLALYSIAPTVPAQLFPLSGGGLQMEWHHGNLDIEIECPPDGPYHVFMSRDRVDEIDEEAGGNRAEELFGRIHQALTEAMGHDAGLLVLGRPL